MADEKPDRPESPVERHVREILAQISALKARLRAQEHAAQSRSGESASAIEKTTEPVVSTTLIHQPNQS